MPDHTEIRLIDIYTSVVRTETKVSAIESQLPDHETRLRALERFRWSLMGAGIASGGVSGWIANLLLTRR